MANKSRTGELEMVNELVARITKGEIELPPGYVPPKVRAQTESFTSTRKATYRGRKISICTTYRIEIDGTPLMAHIGVMNDGTVHCHGLPNYSFSSAINLARAIIDTEHLSDVIQDEIGVSKGHDGGHNK